MIVDGYNILFGKSPFKYPKDFRFKNYGSNTPKVLL